MQSIENVFSLNDFFLIPLYLFLIFIVCGLIRSRNINLYPEYRYFVSGIFLKLLGVSFFCLVYIFYYEGGDTVNYFYGAKALVNLIKYDFDKIIVGINNSKNLKEIINFKTVDKNKMINFNISDNKLIDPRNWKLK